MIKAPKLTAAGDLDLSEPGGSWATGIDVIRDRVLYELNIIRGEWYFDADGGFDLIQIGRNRYSKARLDNELRRCLGRVSGILAIRSIVAVLNEATRNLDFTVDIATTEGGQTVSGSATPEPGFLVPSFAAAMPYSTGFIR